jgi:outer membrane protein OmpA-like peptidoglycan-associated protein
MNKLNLAGLCAAFLLLAGCASERVVLLPSADGKPSAVVVRDSAGERVLDQPYAGSVRRLGSHGAYQSNAEQVQERFGDALKAQPVRPKSFLVYFQEGADALTPESLVEFDLIKADIAQRPAAEIMVIGHTDRVGSLQLNDELSRKRADAVRELLIGAGLPAERIEAAGRGEREPLVPTADEVAEPKNRRVEINVR